MDWTAQIDKVSNGYIMEVENEIEDGTIVTRLVFEEAEAYSDMVARKSELDTFCKLVRELAEYFAIFNSKHERYNLKIEVEDDGSEDNAEDEIIPGKLQ